VRDVNFEQLIILAVVLLAWMVNFVMDRLRNRGRTAQPQDRDEDLAVEEEEFDLAEAMRRERAAESPRGPDAARVPVPVTLPAPETRSADPRPRVVVPAPQPDSRRTAPGALPPHAPAQRATPSVQRRVPPPRSPAGAPEGRRLRRRIDPSEARRGVVLMTILGPCRGVEPPAGDASDRPARRERVE
jgi:hypothetical protein